MTAYEDLHRAVLAAIVREDPIELSGPGNDLTEEYDAEAREIARRLVHAGGTGDSAAVAQAFTATFEESFGTRLPVRRIARMVAALELGETTLGDADRREGPAG